MNVLAKKILNRSRVVFFNVVYRRITFFHPEIREFEILKVFKTLTLLMFGVDGFWNGEGQ